METLCHYAKVENVLKDHQKAISSNCKMTLTAKIWVMFNYGMNLEEF